MVVREMDTKEEIYIEIKVMICHNKTLASSLMPFKCNTALFFLIKKYFCLILSVQLTQGKINNTVSFHCRHFVSISMTTERKMTS